MILFLRNLFFRDFWLKLFSLVLAILIWLTVSFVQSGGGRNFFTNGAIPEQTYYNIPVLVMSSAADVRDFKVSPSVVEVIVRGEARSLKDLQTKDIRALIDLTGIESSRGLRKRIEVTTPAGITLVQVIPDEVEVIVPSKH
jgi:YbbR domain-containing protein